MQSIFVEICIESIGKFKTTTDNLSQKEIAKNTGWSLRTVGKYIKELEKEGFIKIHKSNHKTIGSGSISSSYTPIFKQQLIGVKMDNIIEKYSNNGWQNIGICSIFAEENIQYSKIPLYMHLVRRSFGYCKKVTNRTSQLEM